MRRFLVSLAVAGCASAGPGNSIVGGLSDAGPPSDAHDVPELDAPAIDAPPMQVTLTQNTSSAIKGSNSFACVPVNPDHTPPNSYYRVFTLADHAVATTLHVSNVSFGIEFASAAAGVTQPAKLNLGTYGVAPSGATLDLAQIRPLASADIQIADTISGARMTVPITADVPPTTSLIVELAIPANATVANQFLIGSNDGGERKPGYWRAPTCAVADPTTFSSLADPGQVVDILMTVTGTM